MEKTTFLERQENKESLSDRHNIYWSKTIRIFRILSSGTRVLVFFLDKSYG